MPRTTKQANVYSYWVIEVDHTAGTAQVDFDATTFWINMQFSPESNVMYFKDGEDGLPKRNMVKLDTETADETEWDKGRIILERALYSSRNPRK